LLSKLYHHYKLIFGVILRVAATKKRIHHDVVQQWSECSDAQIVAGRMHAIGQKDDDCSAVQIHPEGGAREPEVPNGIR